MALPAQLVRGLTPPFAWDFAKRRLPGLVRLLGGHYTHIRFEGDYPDFASARRASRGYDEPAILERTRQALLKVKRGEARWEQDAMVSDSDELPWPLLACLARIAASRGARRLTVLDFGGSLGTTYYWCRPFLRPEFDVQWHVVEQPGHVAVGRAEFASPELHFHEGIAEAHAAANPDVLLLSGVLQFLAEPERFFAGLMELGVPHVILDRTPLWRHARHRLTIQQVPREIYQASYPAWFLSEERFLAAAGAHYVLRQRVVGDECWEVDGERVHSQLLVFDRQHGAPN